ncbi:hypothetical protein [Humibacter ginsenosidimutans]|uniref:hypothetical protein n=1 Tax=Humibacter ginsenosidimutans TaxID=2599293 RepID=UPI001AF00AC3|nr:hypothetical protein [Humibacter ginsenosidimutans]
MCSKLRRFAGHFRDYAQQCTTQTLAHECARVAAQLTFMADLASAGERQLEAEAWADAAYLTQRRIERALGIGTAL